MEEFGYLAWLITRRPRVQITYPQLMKNGVAAELAKLTAHDGSWTWAVAFDTTWQPVMPPAGEQWDYDPFTVRAEAERRMRDPQSERFAEPELWERGEGRWEQVA